MIDSQPYANNQLSLPVIYDLSNSICVDTYLCVLSTVNECQNLLKNQQSDLVLMEWAILSTLTLLELFVASGMPH